MVLAQFIVRNLLLLRGEISRLQDLLAPPLVAGSSGEHAAHQVIFPVRMVEGMQAVVGIHSEMVGGDKEGSAGTEGNIALALADRSGTDRGGRVVARAGGYDNLLRDAELSRNFRLDAAGRLIAFKQLWQHADADTADPGHLRGPAFVFHIQKQHAGRIRIVRRMNSGEHICQIILRQHDLADSAEILRLVLLHPENLRRGKAGKSNIGRILRQNLPSDLFIQIIRLGRRSSVIPEDRRTDHLVVLIQDYQSVHLTAERDSCHLALILVFQKLFYSFHRLAVPVFRILFRPAGMREIQGILFGHNLPDLSVSAHQKKLHRRCPKVYTDIQHNCSFPDRHAADCPACSSSGLPAEAACAEDGPTNPAYCRYSLTIYNYLYHSSIDCSFQPNSWQIVPGFSKYCCIQRQRQPCRIRIMDKRRRFKSGFCRTERTLRGNAAGIPHRVPCKLCISEPVQKRFASSSGVSSSVSVGTTIGRARARFSMTTCLWFPPNSPSLVQLIS